MTDSWTFEGIPRIEAELARFLGEPMDAKERWRRKDMAASILLAIKDHVLEGYRLGKHKALKEVEEIEDDAD